MVAPTEEQLKIILSGLRLGLKLTDATASAGYKFSDLRSGLALGAKAKSGAWRDIRQQVVQAQTGYKTRCARLLLRAAKGGSSAAITAIAERLKKVEDLPEDPPTNRADFLRWRLADIRARMSQESGIAYTKLQEAEAKLLAELEQQKQASQRESLENATPEQRATYNSQDAAACSLDDLEIYVAEWCKRHQLLLTVTNGLPALVRDSKGFSA